MLPLLRFRFCYCMVTQSPRLCRAAWRARLPAGRVRRAVLLAAADKHSLATMEARHAEERARALDQLAAERSRLHEFEVAEATLERRVGEAEAACVELEEELEETREKLKAEAAARARKTQEWAALQGKYAQAMAAIAQGRGSPTTTMEVKAVNAPASALKARLGGSALATRTNRV